MPDDLRRYQPPMTPLPVPPPQPDDFEDEAEQEQPEQERGDGKIRWIGAPDHPDAEKHSDGISDLFEVDVEAEEADVDDLVEVDWEKDILDTNENGDLEDLVNVDQSDILGAPPKPRQRRIAPSRRRTIRYVPPTGMRGMR